MSPFLNALLVLVLALNLFMLGTSRILTVIRMVTLQGILLGLMPPLIHAETGLSALFAAAAAIALKGGIDILRDAARDRPGEEKAQ